VVELKPLAGTAVDASSLVAAPNLVASRSGIAYRTNAVM
jgi:hypothetical protein